MLNEADKLYQDILHFTKETNILSYEIKTFGESEATNARRAALLCKYYECKRRAMTLGIPLERGLL